MRRRSRNIPRMLVRKLPLQGILPELLPANYKMAALQPAASVNSLYRDLYH